MLLIFVAFMLLQWNIPSFPIDNFKDHFVLVFALASMKDATEKCHYPELVGEPLRLELNFTFPLEHVLCIGRTNVIGCSWQVWCCWKKHLKWIMLLSSKKSNYPITQVSVPWLFSLWLRSNSRQWHFYHYKHATQQYARWALDNGCKLSSKIVFCRLSWS